MIEKVTIIGSGNVASQLAPALADQVTIREVHSRNAQSGRELAHRVNAPFVEHIEELEPSDLFLVIVQDDQVPEVLKHIPDEQAVAITSGNTDLSVGTGFRKAGIFYPLQTFTRGRKLQIFEVPFLIEGNSTGFAQELFDLAWKVSRNVQFADSEKRKHLHLAAVFTNNFVNHLLYLSTKQLQEKDIDPELLHPLLKETVAKLLEIGPFAAQTGPARRGDLETIRFQLAQLSGTNREIYKLLSESILNTYDSSHD